MKVLITGGAGFAGSHLAEYLVERGYEVTVLAAEQEDLFNLKCLLPKIKVERADLRNARRVLEIISGVSPERIYHLAALSSPSESHHNPGLTYEVNLLGTLNLLLASRERGSGSRVLYVSSSEVYGVVGPDDLPVREETPLQPTSPYAGSKAAAELLACQFFKSYGSPVVRVRPFNHTGPRQSSTFVCSDFARQVAEIDLGLRSPRIVVGNLKVLRDFSDVRDIVRGYHLLLEEGTPGEVYQIGSGGAVSLEEVLRILLRMCTRQVEVIVDQSRLRPHETPALWGDVSKVERGLGWKRQFSLDETLRDLKQYWEKTLRESAGNTQGV